MAASQNTPTRGTIQYLRSVLAADPVCQGATIVNIESSDGWIEADLDDGTTIRLDVQRYNTV